jgi:hypothetical protein
MSEIAAAAVFLVIIDIISSISGTIFFLRRIYYLCTDSLLTLSDITSKLHIIAMSVSIDLQTTFIILFIYYNLSSYNISYSYLQWSISYQCQIES